MWRKALLFGVLGLVSLAVLIQAIPYGRAHANPKVSAEPSWDKPETRELASRSCFDCHSNETVWPWYSNVAPLSWLVQRDVEEGRSAVNFSQWDRPQEEAKELVETVQEGSMPPRIYLVTHPGARLADPDTQALVQGLQATLAKSPPIRGDGGEKEED